MTRARRVFEGMRPRTAAGSVRGGRALAPFVGAGIALAAGGACAAPAPASAPAPPAPVLAPRGAPLAADARFVQHMLLHHGQALVMTALAPERTDRREILLGAERIAVSQRSEIGLMRRWLERRGVPVPDGHEHGAHDAAMPGMLTEAELARLRGASGVGFDRLFLEYMIRHHEGALTMVAELLATPGAAQDSELFGLASDVDADQRAEIRRMRSLLERLPPAPSR